jgi:ABC-type dipeptide/oligopeptide/nickel transport system permease subunit
VSATVESAADVVFAPAVARRGPWLQALARFRRRPLGLIALAVVVLFGIVGALAARLAPYPVGQEFVELIQHPQPPLTAHHLLGTDVLGKDFLTQILFGIRETILSALVCAAVAAAIGTVVGAIAGFFGGWFDALVTWITGVVVAVPAVAVLILVSVWEFPWTPLRFGLWLSAVLWTGPARVVRATVAQQRPREYVEAARASGASGLRIVARHLLPNSLGAVIVSATSIVGQSIVVIATVDYLGYTSNSYEKPTLGGLVADATHSTTLLQTGNGPLSSLWWLYVIPSVLLIVLLVSVALLGDALDDALNPATQ